jgi:hypothetical protein
MADTNNSYGNNTYNTYTSNTITINNIFTKRNNFSRGRWSTKKIPVLKINSIHILVGRQELDSPCPSWQGQIYIFLSKSLERALTFYVTFTLL